MFLPCTPNPTTGFFFYVPRKNIIELDITVEEAATLIMSAAWCSRAPPGSNGSQSGVAAMAAAAQIAQTARDDARRRRRPGNACAGFINGETGR